MGQKRHIIEKNPTLDELVRLYNRRRADGKRAYARADLLLPQILAKMKPGDVAGGYRLVDNYAPGVLKAYRAHGIDRYSFVEALKP